jgi:carboxyl-terminal processing protease
MNISTKPGASNNSPYTPLVYALLVSFGCILGISISKISSEKHKGVFNVTVSKVDEIMDFIRYKYVDTISDKELTEKTIESLLSNLDPHSVYIPEREMSAETELLEGNFEGIGVEFYIVKDTISIVAAIPGGPSEQIGIISGDRIIKINDTIVAGIKITNQQVMRKLKGPGGTKVKVGILRNGSKELKDFNITRGKIPLYSIDASYLIDDKIGYIKVDRFSATTYEEFRKALRKLTNQGIEKLVVDLRQNPGGYLQAATEMADELLGGEKRVVYTQGKAVGKIEYFAKKPGLFERGKLTILIDQNSASASEILAGAIQDWDRGIIVGRTSFGKGLVQEQFTLPEGDALRLTVARYYTPSGRSIQRPYDKGVLDYYGDIYDRYGKGFFTREDTSKPDSLAYKTAKGRTVYGGGGIRPDVFVPIDTTENLEYFYQLRSLIPEFVYADYSVHPNRLDGYENMYEYKQKYVLPAEVMQRFEDYVAKNDLKDAAKFKSLYAKTALLIKAYFAKQKWQADAFYLIANDDDKVMKAALKAMAGEGK